MKSGGNKRYGNASAEQMIKKAKAAISDFCKKEHIPSNNKAVHSLKDHISIWYSIEAVDVEVFLWLTQEAGFSESQQSRLYSILLDIGNLDAICYESDATTVPNAELSSKVQSSLAQFKYCTECNITQLSHEQIVEYTDQLNASKQAQERLSDPAITDEERIKCNTLIDKGDYARDQLIKYMLPSTVHFAISLYHRLQVPAQFPIEDCISDAYYGAICSLDAFDPQKGDLLHYSALWIRKEILAGLKKRGSLISFPQRTTSLAKQIHHAYNVLESKRQPITIENLAKVSGLSEKTVEVIRAREQMSDVVHYDAIVGASDQSFSYKDIEHCPFLVGEDNTKSCIEETISVSKMIDEMKASLDPIEAKVLILFSGLEDGTERSYEDIGMLLGYTKQNIARIKEIAAEKFGNCSQKSISC